MYLGEAQDISGLDIPVHPAAGVQLLQVLAMCVRACKRVGAWPSSVRFCLAWRDVWLDD